MKSKEDSGLKMTDFTTFDKALKLCWVKRLCSPTESPWKIIPNFLLANVGGSLFFQCSYDTKHVKLNVNLPNFYTNLISYWQNLNVTVPPRKLDTLNQIIWNNRFIKIGKLSVFYESCHCAGIEKLSSFLGENECEFLTFNGFQQKFQLNCNFLQYYGLLSAIPKDRKDIIKAS